MQLNPNKLTKKEIVDRLKFRCRHGHNGFSHPSCYASEKGLVERVGCLDIETSNLSADFGIILCWAIYDLATEEILYDHLIPEDLRKGRFDKRVVGSLCDNLPQFDRVVTHYGERFDIPYIRTRALKWGLEERFPAYGQLYHTDVWKIARRKLKLHSNRQGSVAVGIGDIDIKTKIRPDIWLAMQFGTPEERAAAIAEITEHCCLDVEQLASNYRRLAPFVREGRTSI